MAWLENCKRAIAPATGAHHDHSGKVAGAIRCDHSSRYYSPGMGLRCPRLEARGVLRVVAKVVTPDGAAPFLTQVRKPVAGPSSGEP